MASRDKDDDTYHENFGDLAQESEISPASETMRCEHDHANDGDGNSDETTYASSRALLHKSGPQR